MGYQTVPQAKPISTEAVANDAANCVVFLRAIDATVPGYVSEELLAFLEGVGNNRMSLELLTRALTVGTAR